MIMIQKIIILSILLLLSSCVFLTENTLNQAINTNSFLSRFPQNQKAIIIIKLNGKREDRIYLCNKNNVIVKKTCLPIYATSQYRILMLNPDFYYLNVPPKNRPIFSQNNSKMSEEYFAILEAKAGEIAYVGDINYQTLYRKLVVNDNFKTLQNLFNKADLEQLQKLFANQNWEINFLTEQYPHLKKRFKKRLLENPAISKPK